MSDAVVRIAMWSGPRNISTAMMRSFEARGDAAVSDEPFYAAYLERTGALHPLRDAVLASQSQDPRAVAAMLLGPAPHGKPVWYQKHMTHHMLAGFEGPWMAQLRNAFLIRAPRAVLASYAQKRAAVTLADIGFEQQHAIFEREADRLGAAPPVVDAADVLANPGGTLTRLCRALGLAYVESMLHWAPGRRADDGVWAPAWYQSVERSTGFEPPAGRPPVSLPPALERLADAAQPHYDALRLHRLAP